MIVSDLGATTHEFLHIFNIFQESVKVFLREITSLEIPDKHL